MIAIGTTLNQRFLLEKELGHGGMGAVYSATDQVLERNVAIKVLKERSGEEVGKKLRLEAQIAARLVHENVVRIYDFGITPDDETYYLVMEEVKGTSYAKRWRHVALEDRLRILAQVADALDYAHHQGVVHRDVKPGNVLLTAADAPKLSDFGLSILAEQGDHSGIVRGTPLYMSPEQTKGSRVDFRSDLYSLGVMIYESAVGAAPFTGSSLAIMAQHASSDPEPPRGRNPWISEDLEALILSLMTKRPEDRPRSGGVAAGALRQEVDRILRERQSVGSTATAGTATRSAGLSPVAPISTEARSAAGPVGGPGTALPTAPSSDGVPAGRKTEPIPAGPASPSRPGVSSPGETSRSGSLPAASPASRSWSVAVSVASSGGLTAMVRSPLLRKMLEAVLADPIPLTAEERYLHGHYLAYLLSGSRRQGFLLRRPLEPRNADRARLLLGEIEQLLLHELKRILDGAETDASSIEQVAEINKKLREVWAENTKASAKAAELGTAV